MDGFCKVELKPFGPVHNHEVAYPPFSYKFSVLPVQTGELLDADAIHVPCPKELNAESMMMVNTKNSLALTGLWNTEKCAVHFSVILFKVGKKFSIGVFF